VVVNVVVNLVGVLDVLVVVVLAVEVWVLDCVVVGVLSVLVVVVLAVEVWVLVVVMVLVTCGRI
jgi:hypothetical protein